MPIRFLTFFFAFSAVVLLVFAFYFDNSTLALASIPFVLVAAVLFVMTPQLEWQYYKKQPSDLEQPVVQLFAAKLPGWYQNMSQHQKEHFRKQVFLARMAIDFKAQGFEEESVPVDIQALLASQATRVMTSADEHVLEPFETVVVYRHAFPSPQFPTQWHSSETFAEDGVLLFGLERALIGITNPQQHFNVVLYEWFRAAKISRGGASEANTNNSWEPEAERIAARPTDWIKEAVGLQELDGEAVLDVLRLEFSENINALA